MRLLKLATVVALSLLTIAACGGPAAAPTVGPSVTPAPVATSGSVATNPPAAVTNPPFVGTIDPCALLTPAEISAAVGETYAAGVDDDFGNCVWNIEGETGNTGDIVSIRIDPQTYAFLHSLMGIQEGAVDVTVGGHAAFYNPLEFYNALWVDAGGAGTIILSFPRGGDLDPSYQAIATQLGAIALSRL